MDTVDLQKHQHAMHLFARDTSNILGHEQVLGL